MIRCRLCGDHAPVGASIPGLCSVGRGGVHEEEPVPNDLFGPVPALPPKAVDPKASDAGRTLRSKRRDALAAGHERAKKAGDKQEKESPGWFTAAVEHVIHYGRSRGVEGFLIEEAAAHAYKNGLPQPREKRSWGHLPRKMNKEPAGRRLEAIGFDKDGFGSPKTKWRIA